MSNIVMPRLWTPSYKSGYARSQAESANPGLWPSGAWVPALGETGRTLHDVATNNITNTFQPDVTWDRSKGVQSLYFDGGASGDWIKCPGDVRYQSPEHSLVVYCKSTNTSQSNTGIFSNHSSVGSNWLLWFYTDDLKFNNDSGGLLSWDNIGTTLWDGEWHSIVVTRNTSESKMWVDGDLKDTGAAGTLDGSPLDIHLAAYYTSGTSYYEWEGSVASFLFYDHVLTPNEIQQLYADHLAPFRQRSRLFSIPEAAPATTTTLISVPRRATPSYKSGFARSAAESDNAGLWDGLVGAWAPALGVTGGVLRDQSGFNNHGTLTNMGADDWVPGEKDYALDYNNDADAAVLLGTPDYPTTGTITVSMWIYPTVVDTNQVLFSYAATNREKSLAFEGATDEFRLSLGIQRGITSASSIFAANSWHHIVHSWDGNKVSGPLWLNGVAVVLDATGANFGVDGYMIGARDPVNIDYSFNGKIGHTLLWNRGVTTAEVQTLYQDHLAPFRQKPRIFSIPAAAPATTTTLISVPRRATPSYKSGYARSRSESRNPGLWDGLTGLWATPLGVTGGALHDQSGHHYDGDLYNFTLASDWLMTPDGWALNFDNNNNYIGVDDLPVFGTSDFTLSIRMIVNDFHAYNNTVASLGASAAGEWMIYDWATTPQQAFYTSGGALRWNRPVTSWYDLALVRQKDQYAVYIDGQAVTPLEDAVSGDGLDLDGGVVADTFGFGARDIKDGAERFLNGRISHVRVYHRALTANEVKQYSIDPLAPFRQKPLIFALAGEAPPATDFMRLARNITYTPGIRIFN